MILFSPKFSKVAGESREVVWRWGSGGAHRGGWVVVGACVVESGRGMRLAVTSTQVGGETSAQPPGGGSGPAALI